MEKYPSDDGISGSRVSSIPTLPRFPSYFITNTASSKLKLTATPPQRRVPKERETKGGVRFPSTMEPESSALP